MPTYEFNGKVVKPALTVSMPIRHENVGRVIDLVNAFIIAGKIHASGQIESRSTYEACHEIRRGQDITPDDLQELQDLGATAAILGQEFAATPA